MEVIANPICPACLEIEMGEWLAGKKENTAQLLDFIGLATAKAICFREVGTYCIICGARFSVCPHCFCSEVYRFICRKVPELEEEFLTHFGIHFKIGFV